MAASSDARRNSEPMSATLERRTDNDHARRSARPTTVGLHPLERSGSKAIANAARILAPTTSRNLPLRCISDLHQNVTAMLSSVRF